MSNKLTWDCGCAVLGTTLVYCSKHAAAFELYEALNTAILMLRAIKCTGVVVDPLEAVLAKAQGKETPCQNKQ